MCQNSAAMEERRCTIFFQLLDEEVRISKLLAIKRDLAFIFFEILAQSFENFLEIR